MEKGWTHRFAKRMSRERVDCRASAGLFVTSSPIPEPLTAFAVSAILRRVSSSLMRTCASMRCGSSGSGLLGRLLPTAELVRVIEPSTWSSLASSAWRAAGLD